MNKIICFLFILLLVSQSKAQTVYGFEETSVPAQWGVQPGTLSVNGEHYKEGTQSLRWQTTGQSVLTVAPGAFTTSTSNCIYFQLYSPTITNDEVKVDFYNGVSLVRSMRLVINYKGWREVCRAYTEFANSTQTSITRIQFTLYPTDPTAIRTLYVDDVSFNAATPSTRVTGTQWIKDNSNFAAGSKLNLTCYAYATDIEPTTPTAAELSSLATLRSNSAFILSPKVGTSTELSTATAYAQGLNIVRNSDGSVHGNPVALRATDLNESVMTNLSRHLEVLAANGAASSALFNNLLDHLLDQGFAEGVSFNQDPNSYTAVRDIPKQLFNILPSCNATQKEEVLKLCKWIIKYGDLYRPQDIYLSQLNSDIIYNYCLHFMKVALNQSTNDLAVRELKAFKRYLDRNSEYTPGGNSIFKPDGTGFHHNTHYNNYMYAYMTYAQYMYYLKGTPFRVERDTYDRFKKAVLSVYKMANYSSTDNRYMALSLCGRKPVDLQIRFNKTLFEYMVSVGADLYGQQDNEMAAAYNYFYNSTKYTVPSPVDYAGFYAFNYSPLGIYRQAGWVASMRSPTTKFWGSEIYSATNRFGRYQSHGTLEILYADDITNSGYPSNATMPGCGGWDWNVVPGATTVHYTSWIEMMPNKNTTDRFDQFTRTSDFAGALSWGDFGLFAADFDQIEIWGSQRFTPTNLVFKKTVLAIDQMLIDIGSNISSSGSYDNSMITATNLFQNIIHTTGQSMQVDGVSVNSTYSNLLAANTAHTILSPVGTGYIIPGGNDTIKVVYGTQSSPRQDGSDVSSPTTTVTAAKAYIVHGVKPTEKSYQFVALPSATAQTLSQLATKVKDGELYQVLSANSSMHALLYKPKGITAYSFFEAVDQIPFGIVRGITTEALLMHRKTAGNDSGYDFAIANPNLHPTSDPVFSWVCSPTTTVLTLVGKWQLKEPVDGVSIVSATDTETRIQISLSQGEPRYFSLINTSVSPVSSETVKKKPVLVTDRLNDTLRVYFADLISPQVEVTYIYPNGMSSTTQTYSVAGGVLCLSHPLLHAGVNIVKIRTDGEIYTIKQIY